LYKHGFRRGTVVEDVVVEIEEDDEELPP